MTHLRVIGFPFHQHLTGFLHQRGFGFGLGLGFLLGFFVQGVVVSRQQGFHLLLKLLVEQHIEVADEVVALLARRLGRAAVAPLQPCQHAFADVDATVVDQIDAHHFLAVGLHNLRNAPTKEVVTDMAQVQRLIRVGRGILNDHILTRYWFTAKLTVLVVCLKEIHPELI